ncbi:pre-mRNA splicing factor [Trametes meyenii]|nr:pre-mRNA splicing factor [Trametes meyenii]
MDSLKAEIAVKRKALEIPATEGARPTKYMRRGELERLKEEQEKRENKEKEAKLMEEREREERGREQRRREKAIARAGSAQHSTNSPHLAEGDASGGSPAPDYAQSFHMSNEETIRRLRAKGQPIRLFGESDKERRLRLRALELIEEKDHERHGGQNDFKKALEDVENVERQMKDKQQDESVRDKGKKRDAEASLVSEVLDLELVKSDPDKLYPIIYYALKRALKEWEQWMDERPEHVKRTTQGKLAAATQRQSAEYLKPLFKLLRARNLPPDMLARIAEIVHHMQKRQYQKANDSYLRLSIGNAPWPIGVTMVGIHERSAREKISADQVAHVLNDEVSRKYIQSLKRILTFAQTKYPPEDVTQLMG